MCAAIAMSGPIAGETLWQNGEWEFSRDCKSWTVVTVPHDWAIAGPFNPDENGGSGKLPWKGKGYYRRDFMLPDFARCRSDGSRFYLECDGVMSRPSVKVNGVFAGGWDYGYMSFALDVTEFLKDGTNRVEIAADTRYHQSRWYPGAGIYRDIRFVRRAREHVMPGTLFITTPKVSKSSATVHVSYVSSVRGEVAYDFVVGNPRLWDVDDPHLYSIDILGEKFRYGIRTIEWTADDGFHLNGRRVQLNGVNLHSDMGPLGMAFDRDVMKRQLLLMKDMGANALRTSHNAPAPQVLDLCDELGIVVWDECFDKWEGTAGRRDDENLDVYVTRNLRQFVRRDRNHPCVILWSIGNEMFGSRNMWAKDRPLCDFGQNPVRNAAFRAAMRELDATRPVGNGNCFREVIAEGCFKDLDVTGWNYCAQYRAIKKAYPDKPCVYSESASALSSYGDYEIPPAANKVDYHLATMEVGSYDHNAALWSDIPDVEFARMEVDRYCAGEFVWTGIDYLGEPTPYCHGHCFPMMAKFRERDLARSSYFGIVDLMGIPKDRYYIYRAYWNRKSHTCHILPHWNWNGMEGKSVPVYVYTDGDSAELFLNGRTLGVRRKCEGPVPECIAGEAKGEFWRSKSYYDICSRYRLRWTDVPYEAGELKAVSYRNGAKCGECVMKTAGKPVAVSLRDDPYNAQEAKTRFVQVDLVDANGVRCPIATDRVLFSLSGPGEIVAVGNANPRGFDSFKDVKSHPLHFGKAVVVVRRNGNGEIVLNASVPGLADGVLRSR